MVRGNPGKEEEVKTTVDVSSTMQDNLACENCHKKASQRFRIIEPGVMYRLNSTDNLHHIEGTFCTVACVKSFAGWMLASGSTQMPKGWKVEKVSSESR